MDYLNTKYADPATSDLLDMSSLVDPRFKTKFVSSKQKAVLKAESLLADQRCFQPDPAVFTVAMPADQAFVSPPVKKVTLRSFSKKSTAPTNTILTQRQAIEN